MSSGDDVFHRIQSAARSTAAKSGTRAPTQEYLIRHTAAYGVRRPTKESLITANTA